MSTNVEPEEAEAINALAQEESSEDSPAAVVQRDFRRPNRFSGSSLESFRRVLGQNLPKLDQALRSQFKCPIRTEATDIAEVGAQGLFDDLEAPFALGGFSIGGQPGWIQWDIRAAVQAIELLLGSAGEPDPRPLSSIEGHLLKDVFGVVIETIASALNIEATDQSIVATPEEIVGWQDSGPDAEAHRLLISIQLEGIGEGSSFHIYLPGISQTNQSGGDQGESAALPIHLNPINVELGAYLGCSEIPLDDLLALEIGDVIPLGTLLSEPLQIRVEGHECGTAEMGTHNGNRAIRVIEVSPRTEGNE